MPLSDRYSAKTDKIISDLEMKQKYRMEDLRNKVSAGACDKPDVNDHHPISLTPSHPPLETSCSCLHLPMSATCALPYPFPVWKLFREAVPERGSLRSGSCGVA